MGMVTVSTHGSYPNHLATFSAQRRGHAHAVAQAIRYLAEEVLPEAIERDHRLHAKGQVPIEGFEAPSPDESRRIP